MDHAAPSGLPRMIKSATNDVVFAVALLLASHNPRITSLACELAGVTQNDSRTLGLCPSAWPDLGH